MYRVCTGHRRVFVADFLATALDGAEPGCSVAGAARASSEVRRRATASVSA